MKKSLRAAAVCGLLAVAVWASGCNNTTTPNAQNNASGVWQASLTGGTGTSSGFSFITEFTVASANGALSITNFQFLNTSGCYPVVTGATPTGALADLAFNSADQLTGGTLSFTVTQNGNTLTLASTGISGTLSGNVISGGTITGNWTMSGSGTGCTNTSGQFTMTQSSSTSTSTSSSTT